MALASDAVASRAASDAAPGGERAPAAGPQAPEELVETQLRSILEATSTVAGAVCLFDQHQELLRLAVEIGLSDEGCRRLRNIRRGSATTWDMPLHSLLNRRAYLIESAAKNRYVPPLIDDVASVRSVACIPLYDGPTAVGSLILVSGTPFGERQVRLLESPVRELVAAIGAMRKRASTAAPTTAARPSLASRAGAAAPLPIAAVTTAGPIAPGIKNTPGDPGAGSSSSVTAAVERARAELERLRTRVAEAEETATRERTRAATAEQHLAASQTELEQVRAALAERTAEQQVTTERLQGLELALATAEATEAALRAQVGQTDTTEHERLIATAAEHEAALAALERRLADAEAERERLRTRTTELEHTGRSALTDAETRASEALVSAQAQTAAAGAELERLRVRTTELETAHEAALSEAAAAEGRVNATLDDVAAWKTRCETIEAELEHARASLATRGNESDAIVHERTEIERELAAAQARATSLEARLAEVQQELERATDDKTYRDGFAHLESLIQTGVDSGDVPTNPEKPAFDLSTAGAFEVVDLDADGALPDDLTPFASDGPGLDIEEVGTAAPVQAAPEIVTPVAAPEGILVIDVDAAWANGAPKGTAVTSVSPDADVAAEVTARNPERLLLNLAAPNALASLTAVRTAGHATPCFAYVGVPGQPRALPLGRLEVATRPIDPDSLLGVLGGVFTRGTRVVTAGADVDGLISLRQALARLGASVSMAWDAKQANDLLGMVHPDVAIVDLELPPRDGCAVVARLGAGGQAPMLVVIPKPVDCAPAFVAALNDPALAKALVGHLDILASAATRPLVVPKATPLRR